MMFGIVFATLNESVATPEPIAATSSTFHRNPVIRLISDAIAIRPDALATEGPSSFGCSGASAGRASGASLIRGMT